MDETNDNNNNKIAHFPFMLGMCVKCGKQILRYQTESRPVCVDCAYGEVKL